MTAVADPFAAHALDADPFAKHAAPVASAPPAADPFAKHAAPAAGPADAFTPESSIDRYAKQYGLDAGYARQIAGVETGGTPSPDTATSKAGARGRFQLMPGTFKEMAVGDNITDPDQNVNAGTKYLSQQMKRYGGNRALAAAAYNAGPGAVDAYLAHGTPLPAETIAYAAHFGGLPSPKHDTRESDFANQSHPAAVHPAAVAADPFAKHAVPAHPLAAGAPGAVPPAQRPPTAPLALSGQITNRPHVVGDPFDHQTPAQRETQQQAATHSATTGLDAAGQAISFLNPAGGPAGAVIEDAVNAAQGKFPANGHTMPQTEDMLKHAFTGKPGADSFGSINQAHGLFEDAFDRLGLGNLIQGGDRAVQAFLKKTLPPPTRGEATENPGMAMLRHWANDPSDPVMTESTVRAAGEFLGNLGKTPGNMAPEAALKAGASAVRAVPRLAREEVAAVRQINPAMADRLANAGESLAGTGDAAASSVNRYHTALQDVHPADRAKAQVALRAHDTARPRSIAMADKLVDDVFGGAAPEADNRIIDAYQSLFKGKRVVNAATDEERVAAQALRDAVAGEPQSTLAERPIRQSLGAPEYVTKANPAGATEITQRVLADHPGVDPERAMTVAQAMEHAERMPADLTNDEIQRARKLANAEEIAWKIKAKHPELVKGIDREKERGYFPMSNAFSSDDTIGGGIAGGQRTAVDYGHLKPAKYQTVAEARLHAPMDSPDKVLFGKASPREVFRRAMQRQIESAYSLDAIGMLRKLRSNTPGRMLVDSPSYISPMTDMAAPKSTAIKDLEKVRKLTATPSALEDVLGPGATEADLPRRRPRLATPAELRGLGSAARSADAVAAQAGRDADRVEGTLAQGLAGTQRAAEKVAGITPPTARVSADLEPRIEKGPNPERTGMALNRGLAGIDQSVTGQATRAAAGVERAGQKGTERTSKAVETTLKRVQRGTAKFTDRYKSAVLARHLSLQDRDVLDRFDAALQKHIDEQEVTPKTLFDPESIKGYQPLSKLRSGLQGEDEDLHAVDGIHQYLAMNNTPADVSSPLARALDAARRTARSSLVFNYVIHTGWNEGGITMAHMGPAGAHAVADAMTEVHDPHFEDWFKSKTFSDEPGDTMAVWDRRGQDNGAWHPSEYGSYAVGDAREVARDATGKITGYRDTPNRGADYATMRTAPLSSIKTLRGKAEKIGYEMQRWNSNIVFNRGERIYSAYLMRHFVKNEWLSDAEAANKVRQSFSDDTMTNWERNATQSWAFFYPWMRTANKLAIKLGIQKPQTWNAGLESSRVQRDTVGAGGVEMSKSNPYSLARPSEQGGFDYWAPPLWNRMLEPAARTAHPPQPAASFGDRFDPAAEYLAGHLAPVPGLAVDALQESRMGSKAPPWEQLVDPNAPPSDWPGAVAHGVAGQFLYPLRAAEEAGQKRGAPVPGLIGGSVGHRSEKTIDETSAREQSYTVYELGRQIKAAESRGDEASAARLRRDLEFQQGR